MENLKQIYERRFGKDIQFRVEIWKVLCHNFFQKYIPKDSVVLDMGAGYCEFINNIKAKRKIALDLNPNVKKFASDNVKVIISSSTDMYKIKNETIDVVFTSNFFEHISKKDIIKTVQQVNRVLKKKGKFLILQPNIRYSYKDYWMFFDHITPLDDRSISEVLEINGFKVMERKSKFLPYSTKTALVKSLLLLKIYLKMPIIQKIIGKQAFIYAQKI